MAEVKLRNLWKIYDGKFTAVKDVNIDIEDREFIVLVGPSGCGKSTTLRMVAGLEDITKGEISIDGRVINEVPPKDRDIAMVFQNYALYPHMTVYNNMAFGLKLKKFSKEEIDRRVKEAADILGINELLQRKPKQLSGGQRQRVAVGRAIVRHPKVFLFDEPLSNLDAKLRVQMRTELSKLHSRLDATMIYVTHDQMEAMTMADRIVVMKDGIVHQIDSPLNLYHHPANKFVAGFIGSPHMNFFKGRIVESDNKIFFRDELFNLEIPQNKVSIIKPFLEKEIWLGIRPEDIHALGDVEIMKNWQKIKSKIEVVEPMGSEAFVNLYHPHVESNTKCYIARISSYYEYKVNTNGEFLFDMDKIHFFDVETECVIK